MQAKRLAKPPTDCVADFINNMYIVPARQRGDAEVSIGVLQAWKGIEDSFGPDRVRAVLGSLQFRTAYNLSLKSKDQEENMYVFGLQRDVDVNPDSSKYLPFELGLD